MTTHGMNRQPDPDKRRGDPPLPIARADPKIRKSRLVSNDRVMKPALTMARHPLLAICLWLAAVAWSAAGNPLPEWFAKNRWEKPPESHVRDDNGFFNRTPGMLKALSENLRDLESDHGFRLYLVVEPALIGTTPPEIATTLQDTWVPDGKGLVVVFEADSRSLGFGQIISSEDTEPDARGFIPSYASAAILNQVKRDTNPTAAPEDYIESVMRDLSADLTAYFVRRAEPPPAARNLRIGLFALGSLAVVGLAAILLAPVLRHPAMGAAKTFRFPVVERPERLGAPFGGGDVTTRKFGGNRRV